MFDEGLHRGISKDFEDQLTGGILSRSSSGCSTTTRSPWRSGTATSTSTTAADGCSASTATAGPTASAPSSTEHYCNIDPAYCPTPARRSRRTSIGSEDDAQAWVEAFASYKQVMDVLFSDHPKLEREYQQTVLRDNNRHVVGERTDYMILDIEYAQSPRPSPSEVELPLRHGRHALADAEAAHRASGLATPVIIEMKAGDGALASHAAGARSQARRGHRGLPRAARRAASLAARTTCCATSSPTVFAPSSDSACPRSQDDEEPRGRGVERASREVIFVLANHQPASTILRARAREAAAARPRRLLGREGHPTPATRCSPTTSYRSTSSSPR